MLWFLQHYLLHNIVIVVVQAGLLKRELPWHNIRLSDNPVEVLNEHLSLLVGRYVPIRVIRVRKRINLSFMINAGMLLAPSWRLIFGGHVIALGLTGKSLPAIKCSDAKKLFFLLRFF